jgi:photosystem II stability/assembly factor-like uncharacterized protein
VLALIPGPDGVWASGHGGVAWLPTGGQWAPLISGLPLTSVAALTSAGGWLLAGGAGGLARSRDGGQSWQLASSEGHAGVITALAVSPRFAEDTTAVAASIGAGLLRTTDAGAHWRPATFGLQTAEVTALVWHTGETVYAATDDGIYRSPNAGRAWRICEGTEGMPVAALTMLEGGSIFAALEQGGLLRLIHTGAWEPHGDPPHDLQATALLAARYRGEPVLLLGTSSHGLLRSSDGGATWSRVSDALALVLATQDEQNGASLLYAGTETGLLLSTNGGASWEQAPPPPLHDLRRLLVDRDALVVVGVHSPPVRSQLHTGWAAMTMAPLPISAIAAHDGALVTSSMSGLFRSNDGGQTWQSVVAGEDGCVAQLTFRADGHGWAGSADSSRLLRTRDGGLSWEPLDPPFGVLPLAALQAVPGALFAATYDPRRQTAQLWRSADDGASWERGAEVRTAWPIVATCDRPPLLALGGTIFFQRDGGSWRQSTPGSGGIRRVACQGDTLLILAEGGVYRSDDGGASWQRDDAGLPIPQVMDIALKDGNVYALLAGGQVWARAMERGMN